MALLGSLHALPRPALAAHHAPQAAPPGFLLAGSSRPDACAGTVHLASAGGARCVRAAAAMVADTPPLSGGQGGGLETVADAMTYKKVFYVRPDTTIDEALEILVHNHITGLPVLDEDEKLVGVVSDFDLLSLDHISGEREVGGIFPDISTDWQSFQDLQKLILKNHGKLVEDVMTPSPITVRMETSLEDAARTLLDFKVRRLPVLDARGKLIGMFSRGDVIRAAVRTRRAIKSAPAPE